MSKRRLTIARRLVEAQHTAAMLTTFNEIDMTAVQEIRKRAKEAFKARYGVGLGITSFFVKAAVGSAARVSPAQCRDPRRGDGSQALLRHRHRGRRVEAAWSSRCCATPTGCRSRKSSARSRTSRAKAEDGTLSLDDLRGGTFTITNGGVFGSLMSTPILNPPQVGILGLHKIEDRAVPLNGQVVVRPMMYVALSYDHRIVDGLEAVQFLVRIKEIVEDPATLLLEA